MGQRRRGRGVTRLVAAFATVGVLTTLATTGSGSPAVADDDTAEGTALYLVTLRGPGTAGYLGALGTGTYRTLLTRAQDAALERVEGDQPVYRWTTALNGFAAELTDDQAAALRADVAVVLVEENSVRPLASHAPGRPGLSPDPGSRGGAGQVVGVVDTGIWPESPVFAATPDLGRAPDAFRGACVDGDDWRADACNAKLVGARWFVDGFGADRVRASSSLSPRDDNGHGTLVASIAAGNAGVSVEVPRQRLGTYGGIAPRARIAAYKACWTAPDPADDGCAAADLVTAIDRATRDRVDVLNLSAAGPPGFDTVERALLGAAEGGIVVVAAAGNDGRDSYSAHASPWVTTVGATTGDVRRGSVVLADGTTFTGAMAAGRGVRDVRLVRSDRVAAPDATRNDARLCRPGSLDAARVAGTVVVCERGGLGRIEKSAAVRRADGIGMVLVNGRPGPVVADLHEVPSVHLSRGDGAALDAWLADHPRGRVSLRPLGVMRSRTRMTSWSTAGDPASSVLKPDVVAPGVGLLGSVPPSVRETRWDFATGTSAATAWTSGLALRLLARHDWSADLVRSSLATTATSVAGSPGVLDEGAGLPRERAADAPGLALLVAPGDYRAWLDGLLEVTTLNTPSVLLTDDRAVAARTLTNVAGRAASWSVEVSGFERHAVSVSPASFALGPDEAVEVEISVGQHDGVEPTDDGWLTWRGSDSSVVRIPVVLSR